MRRQFRHGDVLIESVADLPATREKLPHTILAYGEVTGHCHRIKETDAAELFSTVDGLFLHVRAAEASVIHEEHAPVRLTSGFYRVWRQREYTPKAIQVVRD